MCFHIQEKDGLDMDEMILDLIDYGVDDEYDEDEESGEITIYGDPKSFGEIQNILKKTALKLQVQSSHVYPMTLKTLHLKSVKLLTKWLICLRMTMMCKVFIQI